MSRPRRAISSKTSQIPQVLPPSVPLSSPGVLILSLTRHVLYVTPNAHKFLEDLDGSREASWDGAVLPFAVQHVCNELHHDRKQDRAGTDLQVRHLERTAHGTILVRGYTVFEKGAQPGRFLILFETVSMTSPTSSDQGGESEYHFTDRQRAIVNGLVLGFTNKQIAESMLISVHTVKEYIRQLMMKLHTETRTGIVARVAGLTLPSATASSHPRSPSVQTTVQVG